MQKKTLIEIPSIEIILKNINRISKIQIDTTITKKFEKLTIDKMKFTLVKNQLNNRKDFSYNEKSFIYKFFLELKKNDKIFIKYFTYKKKYSYKEAFMEQALFNIDHMKSLNEILIYINNFEKNSELRSMWVKDIISYNNYYMVNIDKYLMSIPDYVPINNKALLPLFDNIHKIISNKEIDYYELKIAKSDFFFIKNDIISFHQDTTESIIKEDSLNWMTKEKLLDFNILNMDSDSSKKIDKKRKNITEEIEDYTREKRYKQLEVNEDNQHFLHNQSIKNLELLCQAIQYLEDL